MNQLEVPPKLTKTTDEILIVNEDFTYVSSCPQLECPVCYLPLYSPFTHQKCGNCFCKTCSTQLRNCPLCRDPLLPTNFMPCQIKIFLNLLDDLKVKCNTCHKETSRGIYPSHYNNECDIACLNKCGKMIKRKDVKNHWDTCQNTVVKCASEGCPVTFQRKDEALHLKSICNYRLVDCEYCHSKVRRGMWLYHLSSVRR